MATSAAALWNSGQEGSDKAVKTKYNADGTRQEVVRLGWLSYSEAPGTPAGTPVRGVSNFQYTDAGDVNQITHKTDRTPSTSAIANYSDQYNNTAQIVGRDYDFFAPGNVKVREEHRNFAYDERSQLVKEAVATVVGSNPPLSHSYLYDKAGNRIGENTSSTPTNVPPPNATNEVGKANRLLDDGRYTYRYDAEGNLTERALKQAPVVATDLRRETFTWDQRHRLMEVLQIRENGSLTSRITYDYDGLNRHIATRVDHYLTDGTFNFQESTGFVLDGQNVLFDLSLDGGNSKIQRGYLNGPAGHEVLAVDVSTTLMTRTAWAFADPQGTVRSLTTYANGLGWSFVHRHTDAFGNLYAQDGNIPNSILSEVPRFWSGQRFDVATGFYELNGNWYDPNSGRNLASSSGGTNGYPHRGNMPTSNGTFDPPPINWSEMEGPDGYSGWFRRGAGEQFRQLFGDEFLLSNSVGAEIAVSAGIVVTSVVGVLTAPVSVPGAIAYGAVLGVTDYTVTWGVGAAIDTFDGGGYTINGYSPTLAAEYAVGGALTGGVLHFAGQGLSVAGRAVWNAGLRQGTFNAVAGLGVWSGTIGYRTSLTAMEGFREFYTASMTARLRYLSQTMARQTHAAVQRGALNRDVAGPVTATLYDEWTGAVFSGRNMLDDEFRVFARNADPIIQNRLKAGNEHFGEHWPHYTRPGSHAELMVLDQALKLRRVMDLPVDELQGAGLHLDVVWNSPLRVRKSSGPRLNDFWVDTGMSAPTCRNCTYLTDLPGLRRYSGSR